MKNLDCHYCLATKEHYNKLVEDGYTKGFLKYNINDIPSSYFLLIKGTIITPIVNPDSNKYNKPMHLHNDNWIFGSLEHEATDKDLLQEFCDAGDRLHKAVEKLKPKPVELWFGDYFKVSDHIELISDVQYMYLNNIDMSGYDVELIKRGYETKEEADKAFIEHIKRQEEQNKAVERITREEFFNIAESIGKSWIRGYNEMAFEIANKLWEYLEANQNESAKVDEANHVEVSVNAEFNGCSNHSCIIKKPVGIGTNGRCSCLDGLDKKQKINLEKFIKSLKDKIQYLEANQKKN